MIKNLLTFVFGGFIVVGLIYMLVFTNKCENQPIAQVLPQPIIVTHPVVIQKEEMIPEHPILINHHRRWFTIKKVPPHAHK